MNENPETRQTLLLRLREGNDSLAWHQFVEIYAPLVFGYLRKKGLQDADAADLTQDILNVVSQAMPKFFYEPERGTFRAWLFTIVRNRWHNFRQRGQKLMTGESDLFDQLPAQENDEAEMWKQEYRQQLFQYAASQVKQEVAEKNWQAFWQTAVENQLAKDVANGLGMSVSAVYMARSRVLAQIKKCIAAIQGNEDDE